jgi:phospholipase D1/2
MITGQPSRDLCRHFVQRWVVFVIVTDFADGTCRWNLLIRTKVGCLRRTWLSSVHGRIADSAQNHTRRMPFLLPPAEYTDRELREKKFTGTCEVQICRSVGPWSMGTATKIEHSIQNAYVKCTCSRCRYDYRALTGLAIQMSEHYVYQENQFFITSTVVDGVQVKNHIGDAYVERIIRAHKEGTPWRADIVIPLLPGYTYPIDSAEASSVRLILECQNRTIARGTNSIFSRLRKEGIDVSVLIGLRGLAHIL